MGIQFNTLLGCYLPSTRYNISNSNDENNVVFDYGARVLANVWSLPSTEVSVCQFPVVRYQLIGRHFWAKGIWPARGDVERGLLQEACQQHSPSPQHTFKIKIKL